MSDPAPAQKPESAELAAPAATPAKKKSKLIIIIAAAVALLAAAGGGAWFFMSGDHEADEEVVAAEQDNAEEDEQKGKSAKADKKDKKKGKKGKEAPKPPALYVKFEPPFVVNFEAKGLMRFLQIGIEVMTRDQPTADMIKQHDPMLRNDLLLLLGSQTYDTISTREGKEQLRKEALAIVAKVIAAEGGDAKQVEQLYFTSFVMQ